MHDADLTLERSIALAEHGEDRPRVSGHDAQSSELRDANSRKIVLVLPSLHLRFQSCPTLPTFAIEAKSVKTLRNAQKGREADLQESAREGPESGRKPSFDCDHEISSTALIGH